MDREQITSQILGFDKEQRTLKIRVVPYGPTITHDGVKQRYTEVTVPDHVVPFTVIHEVPGETSVLNRVGRIVDHEQTDDGLVATVKLSQTGPGNDLYALASDGLLTEVSGGVIVTDHEKDENGIDVRVGRLDHVAASVQGAFGASEPGSRVLAVHDHDDKEQTVEKEKDAATDVVALTEDDVKAIVNLDGIEDEIRAMRQVIEAIDSGPAKEAERPEGYEVFGAVLYERLTGDPSRVNDLIEKYALVASPGVSGGSGAAEGLIPADWWTAGLVDVRGGFRPLFDHAGTLPYPTTGTSVGYGKVVSGPTADARAAQDGDVESSALVVSAASAAIKWFDGGGRIPIEMIEQSDQAVLAVFYGRLVAAVNAKIETYTVTTAVAAATHEGAVLTLTDYGTLIGDLVTTSELIRVATDFPGNLLGCSTSDWIAILTMVDANDRRLFATQGSAAQDGSAGLLSSSVDIGGITAFHTPGLSESLQFNKAALKVTDKAPRRLQAVNVLKAGVEVGILGSAVVAPMIATGIYSYEAT